VERRSRVLYEFRRQKIGIVAGLYLVVLLALTVAVPGMTGYGAEDIDLTAALAPPSRAHLLGTDESGRDELTRLFVGARGSLTVGLVAMTLAVTAGTLIGAVAGFKGKLFDGILMLLTDAFLAVPIFFILLTTLVLFGPSLQNLVIVIGLTSWMTVARVVRSEVLRVRGLEFVQAARATGVREARVLFRHVLPQATPSIVVAASLGVAYAILVETALSYLGVGVQPPQPSWGNMLTNAQQYIYTAPSLAVFPGLLILLTVLALNYLSEVLRTILDPTGSTR
jgi:peptide/nickel transport system permease protein